MAEKMVFKKWKIILMACQVVSALTGNVSSVNKTGLTWLAIKEINKSFKAELTFDMAKKEISCAEKTLILGGLYYSLCSRKWARPGRSSGSLKLPTPTHRAAADYTHTNTHMLVFQ